MDNYLIILGAGPQQAYAYRTAKEMGLKTVAVDQNPMAKCIPYSDKYICRSVKDVTGCLNGLNELAKRHKIRYVGVMTPGVECAPSVSEIARWLPATGHPQMKANPPRIAYNTTNKIARIKILKEAGIPVPKFRISGMTPLAHPFIIKPSDNSGSRGVQVVKETADWPKALRECHELASDGRVICEEILEGQELSVEGFVIDEVVHILSIADRKYVKDYYPYFMEDGSSSPSNLPSAIFWEAQKVFKKAVKALGIEGGPTKGDLICTKDRVKVLEINSRLAPAFSWVSKLKSGVDLMKATIQWCCGMQVDWNLLMPRYEKGMCHRYFFHKAGKINKIKGFDKIWEMPGVEEVMVLQDFKVGDILTSPTYINRLFYVITIAETREIAEKQAEDAIASIKIC